MCSLCCEQKMLCFTDALACETLVRHACQAKPQAPHRKVLSDTQVQFPRSPELGIPRKKVRKGQIPKAGTRGMGKYRSFGALPRKPLEHQVRGARSLQNTSISKLCGELVIHLLMCNRLLSGTIRRVIYDLLTAVTAQPNNRYTTRIPMEIPTHSPVFPVRYPYIASTPLPSILHCVAKAVSYMQLQSRLQEYVRWPNSLTIIPWKT